MNVCEWSIGEWLAWALVAALYRVPPIYLCREWYRGRREERRCECSQRRRQ